MNKDIFRQTAVVVAMAATIAVNGLANALPLNGQQTGEISDRFKVYFVPAGYVFSIWGLIYIGLILYAIYQALAVHRENPRLVKTGWLFVFSCVTNAGWLFLWHFEYFVLTVAAMVALLGLLIAIYLRLEIGRTKVSTGERWLVRAPFSVYLGWITVATAANITSTLDAVHWSGWGIAPQTWAVLLIVASASIGILVGLTRRDAAYVLVLVWALAGIAIKQAHSAPVASSAWAAAAVLLALAGWIMAKSVLRTPGLQRR